jgi:hypothetical protein
MAACSAVLWLQLCAHSTCNVPIRDGLCPCMAACWRTLTSCFVHRTSVSCQTCGATTARCLRRHPPLCGSSRLAPLTWCVTTGAHQTPAKDWAGGQERPMYNFCAPGLADQGGRWEYVRGCAPHVLLQCMCMQVCSDQVITMLTEDAPPPAALLQVSRVRLCRCLIELAKTVARMSPNAAAHAQAELSARLTRPLSKDAAGRPMLGLVSAWTGSAQLCKRVGELGCGLSAEHHLLCSHMQYGSTYPPPIPSPAVWWCAGAHRGRPPH